LGRCAYFFLQTHKFVNAGKTNDRLKEELEMNKAVIIYNSKTGTTKKYAEEIGEYIKAKGFDVRLSSIQEYREELLDKADYVLLGCWTSGLIFFLQHPQKDWNDFAIKLPNMPDTKMALFTTYKILTGRMFSNMYHQLNGKLPFPSLKLKSRNRMLSENDRKALDSFIG
jgi:flavodoxin